MAEEGVKCVEDHKDNIKECIETSVPEIKTVSDDVNNLNIGDIVINEQQCGYVFIIDV